MNGISEAVTFLDELAQRPDQKTRVQYTAQYLTHRDLALIRAGMEAAAKECNAWLKSRAALHYSWAMNGSDGTTEGTERDTVKSCKKRIRAISPEAVLEKMKGAVK